jgi:hypothetical protein
MTGSRHDEKNIGFVAFSFVLHPERDLIVGPFGRDSSSSHIGTSSGPHATGISDSDLGAIL